MAVGKLSSFNLSKQLNAVRPSVKSKSFVMKFFYSALAFLAGLGLGIFAKFLDGVAVNDLPQLLQTLDLNNFFSRFSFWALITLAIAVYSKSRIRAALNVFLFYAGMLLGYYIYTIVFAGFYPDGSYLAMWIVYAILSPFVAVVCWYAKGTGLTAALLSAIIMAFMFSQAFNVGLFYFSVNYQGLEILLWLASVVILYRSPMQTVVSVVLSIPLIMMYNM